MSNHLANEKKGNVMTVEFQLRHCAGVLVLLATALTGVAKAEPTPGGTLVVAISADAGHTA